MAFRAVLVLLICVMPASAAVAQEPIEWDSKDPETYHDLGMGLMRMREYAAALEAFRSAYEKDDGYIEALMGQAKALERLKRYDEMEDAYRRVLSHSKASGEDRAEAYCAMGTRSFKDERYEKAQQQFENAVKADERHARSWYLLGRCHERTDRWQEAADAYGKAVDNAPANRGYEKALERALDALMWGAE
jgi:tetratricopeptide (TPR) repeat protein